MTEGAPVFKMKWCPRDAAMYYQEPKRHYEGDAGYDLFSAERTVILPGKFNKVPTNIRVELPAGTWALITARSSTAMRGLMVVGGIIDNGWRGELFATVLNTTENTVVVGQGERLVQLILFSLITPTLVQAEGLGESDRGNNGFGSTGTGKLQGETHE